MDWPQGSKSTVDTGCALGVVGRLLTGFLRCQGDGMMLEGMAAGSRDKSRAVLVVDDDPDVRETVAELVASSGRVVFTAGDGSEALSLLDGATVPRPCFVLLDLMMAPMDGRAFLEHVRGRDDAGQFSVLVVSATPHALPKSLLPGVLGTLRKPFAVEQLLAVLDEHC